MNGQQIYFDPNSQMHYVEDGRGGVIFTDPSGNPLPMNYQQGGYQQPMYNAPQQPQQMMHPYQRRNNMGGGYNYNAAPSTRQHAAGMSERSRSAVPEQHYQEQPKQTMPSEEVRKPVVVELKPLEGHEHKPLVPPDFSVTKEQIGETYYRYTVEQGADMDYNIHKAIYADMKPLETTVNIGGKVDNGKFNWSGKAYKSMAEVVTSIQSDTIETGGDDIHVGIIKLVYSGLVEPAISGKTPLTKMLTELPDLKAIAKHIKFMMNKDGVTGDTYEMFNARLTFMLNRALRDDAGSSVKVDSFSDDIDDLYKHLDNYKDQTTRMNIINALSNLLNTVKMSAKSLDNVNDINRPKSYGLKISLRDGVESYEEVMVINYGVATTKNEVVKYELESVTRKESLAVRAEHTPVLHQAISDAFLGIKDVQDIIFITQNHACLVSRTKRNNSFIIRKL